MHTTPDDEVHNKRIASVNTTPGVTAYSPVSYSPATYVYILKRLLQATTLLFFDVFILIRMLCFDFLTLRCYASNAFLMNPH